MRFLTLLPAALLPALVAAGGGYSGSCINIDFSGTTLVANCHNNSGALVSNLLDMNRCLANNGGNIVWQTK
jgi:hypothetical protein